MAPLKESYRYRTQDDKHINLFMFYNIPMSIREIFLMNAYRMNYYNGGFRGFSLISIK
ncbi:hypothetical protein SAMN05444392_11823 [Seinonella peptonophila]|uniref:Uncharacterized protein n=1 Tax=Seinonella peptonophila TaxID=112248 RepID=A0A1M5B4H0_9BACL|nr:hypothetical protein SAMN05444392_11823 [Seinonella peptonophila]